MRKKVPWGLAIFAAGLAVLATSCELFFGKQSTPTPPPTPTFSPSPGTYSTPQQVYISTGSVSVDSIRYSLDGSDPWSGNSITYVGGTIPIASTTTIKAISVIGSNHSSISTGSFVINIQVSGTVAKPSFSIPGDTYTGTQTVSLATTTTGASIRYTTDGSTPTSSTGTLYSAPISVAATQTINAIAYLSGWTDSTVASATYTILTAGSAQFSVVNPWLPVITFTGNPASLASGSTMTVTATVTPTPDTYAWYLDGAAAASASTSVLTLGASMSAGSHTIALVVGKAGELSSDQFTVSVGGAQVASPTFSVAAGTYTSAQSVALSTTTGGAAIRYTTDGTTPTSSTGTVYSSPINVSSTLTIRAIAYLSGYSDSSVASAAYTINVTGGAAIAVTNPWQPTISFSGNSASLASGTSMTVTATVTPAPTSYVWYLYGVAISGATGASVTLGSSAPVGSHAVVLVVQQGSALASSQFVFSVATSVAAYTYTTTTVGGNSQSGIMFNLTASRSLTVKRFSVMSSSTAAVNVAVYYRRDGTLATTSSGWTNIGNANVTFAGTTTLVEIPLDLNIYVPAGSTYGFYVTTTDSSTTIEYSNSLGTDFFNSDLTIGANGYGIEYYLAPFGATYYPRSFNGRVSYTY